MIRLGLAEQAHFPSDWSPPVGLLSPPSACDVQERVSGSHDRTVLSLGPRFPGAELCLLRLTGELGSLRGFLEEFAFGLRAGLEIDKRSSGEVLPPSRTLTQNPADFVLFLKIN